MNIYEVQPIFSHPTHPFELTIDAPGSKSITNRALMLAALANGETLLKGALFSDDSRHFLQCLKDLGFDVVVDEPAHTVRVTGLGGRIPKETAAINSFFAKTHSKLHSRHLLHKHGSRSLNIPDDSSASQLLHVPVCIL